jgi:hypothetical protein
MKYTIYIKKEIKSKADLPRENDRYAVHSKGAGLNDLHDSTWMRLYKDSWLRDYDYYLQPIELDLLDDEVICKLAKDRYRESSNSSDKINSYCDGMELLRDNIKNQLKQQL